VVDFGTATTFDNVNDKGEYVGGVIAPGVNLSLDALQKAAAKLPNVSIARPEKVVATNTIGAMQSGIYYGYVGLVEGIISRICEERNFPAPAGAANEVVVIATGGLASLYARICRVIEHVEPDLTMLGLKQIYEGNRS
ncbi:MAG: type III pantothenate kinase, partial [Alphaproteobacteria bacterium]